MMNKGRNSHDYEAISEESSAFDLRRGPWTLEEDNLLIHYITCHGEGRWNTLAKCAGLKRTGKSCRLRWLNYLKPDIKRGNLTPQEQLLILELHSKWGNRWSKIAQHLPGRTDNEIKNYWRTRVQKQARQLNVDSNSRKFLEAIRSYWMPRLVEKMEQKNYSLSSHSSTSPSSLLMKNHSQAEAEAQVQAPPFEDYQKEKSVHFLMTNSIQSKGYSDSSSADDHEILENPTTISSSSSCPVLQTLDEQYNVGDTIRDGCYHVDMISSYNNNMEEGEGFEMSAAAAAAVMESTNDHDDIINLSEYDHHEINTEAEDQDHLFINGGADNCSSGISSSLWNLDDLWHFRKSERWP